MNLKEAMAYLAANHEAMAAGGISMAGSYVRAAMNTDRAICQTFSLSYEPLAKDDPNCGAYRIELLRSVIELESTPSVVLYGDSVEELRAAAGNDYAVEADYSTVMPPVPLSPDLEGMIDSILADFKKRIQP